MNSNDVAVEKTELVISVLHYAHEHNLDINKREDVEEILEVLDPKHTEDIDKFVELLKNADAFMEMTAREKSKKTDLVN